MAYRCVVIGGVGSTEVLVRALHRHGFDDVTVYGYVPANRDIVSGWCDLEPAAEAAGYRHVPFRRLADHLDELAALEADMLFAVGLSQIVPERLLATTRLANIGFHPTDLPDGRGRAPIAWLILRGRERGAATFFEMSKGVDDGPIHAQRTFAIEPDHDAGHVEAALLEAEARALDAWLPELAVGRLDPAPQDHAKATWTGARRPEDGRIDWSAPASDILRMIRASAPPHPGGFTFQEDRRITLLAAEPESRPIVGVPGRVLETDAERIVVQAGDGPVAITAWSPPDWAPRVGARLGWDAEMEVVALRERVARLEEALARLSPEARE